jgi:uncharacterized membrane protein YbhN (UPF0104 family)
VNSEPRTGITATPVPIEFEMPREAEPRRLVRRGAQALVLLGVLFAVALLAPGLGQVRDRLHDASVAWLAVAVGLEALSCWSYVIGFRPIFCAHMSWRSAIEISWAELGIGSIVPASGAGGLVFGAWILRRGGMATDYIARRSVAFFLLKSLTNFLAVAVIGGLLAVGLLGPHQPLWRTALPAAAALAAVLAVLAIGSLKVPERPPTHARRLWRWLNAGAIALVGGVRASKGLVRVPAVVAGNIGYWAFDNAVLWATYHAVGTSPPITVILMGYLIGQLGGALPLPGGIGGIDFGLIGALLVYGAPASATVAAVLAYRVILFWLPLLGGAVAFVSLRRGLNNPDRPDLCLTPAPASAG